MSINKFHAKNKDKFLDRGGASEVTAVDLRAHLDNLNAHDGVEIDLDTTNFNNNLGAIDDTVQKALDTIDNLVIGGVAWGDITGTLSNQTDLQAALDLKIDVGSLRVNLIADDGINIQIDEIRARDVDGLKLNDDSGNGIFIKDGGTLIGNDISLLPNKSLYQGVYPSDEDSVLNLSLRDIFDRSPFGNDLILEGTATISSVAGRIGSGLRLDGTAGTHGRVVNNASLQFTDLLTVEAWIFPNTNGVGFHPIVSKTVINTGNGWNFTYQDNGLRITFRKNNNAGVSDTIVILEGQVPTSIYTHIAMTFDASTNALKVYINGELKDSRTFVATIGTGNGWSDSANDLIIGNRLANGTPSVGNNFDGDISNVHVYNRVLADEEIRIHYLRGSNYESQSAIVADRWKVLDTDGKPWMDFNKTSRKPFTHDPTEVFDIYQPSDLGTAILAPDGVMRVPLVADAKYIFHKDMVIPRLLMPKVINPGTFELVEFIGVKIVALFFDGDETPHIWGREVGGWFANNLQFIDISNAGAGRGTVLFDMVGGNAEFSAFSTFVVAHANFKQIGRLVDMGLFQGHISQDSGNASGFTLRVTPENGAQGQSSSISLKRFLGSASVADNKHPAYTFIGDLPEVVLIGNAVDLGKPANSFLHLDSGTSQGNYVLHSNAYLSVAESGEFFRPDLITSITAQSNADIAITSFSDAGGGNTNVNFGAIFDFIKGQVILIADATQGSLNSTHTIVSVADDQKSFVINIGFVTDSTANLKMVKHTVASNKYTRDETVTISDTTNYNGTHQILREDDTSFHLPQAFVSDEATGTATSTGRDCNSIGVSCLGNGVEEDSKNVGSYLVNNNTVATSLVSGVWTDLDLGGIVLSANNIQRFTITNTTTGEIRYDGLKPFSGSINYTAYATSTGGARDFKMRTVKNGSVLPDTFEPVQSIDSKSKQFQIIVPILLVTGDLVRPQALRVDGTSTLTVSHMSMSIL